MQFAKSTAVVALTRENRKLAKGIGSPPISHPILHIIKDVICMFTASAPKGLIQANPQAKSKTK